jgi:hypothetical protein
MPTTLTETTLTDPAPVIIGKAYLLSKGMKKFMGYRVTHDEEGNLVFWLRGSITPNKEAIRAVLTQYPDSSVSPPELVTRGRKKSIRKQTLRKSSRQQSQGRKAHTNDQENDHEKLYRDDPARSC